MKSLDFSERCSPRDREVPSSMASSLARWVVGARRAYTAGGDGCQAFWGKGQGARASARTVFAAKGHCHAHHKRRLVPSPALRTWWHDHTLSRIRSTTLRCVKSCRRATTCEWIVMSPRSQPWRGSICGEFGARGCTISTSRCARAPSRIINAPEWTRERLRT